MTNENTEPMSKNVMLQIEDYDPDVEAEIPDHETKVEVLEYLVNDEEIIMLYDDMNNCYRPLWKNEWDVQQEVKSDDESQADIEKYRPYVATVKDINTILENGTLEWCIDGRSAEWYMLIWW
jgi:hypothetical protein